VHCTVIITKDRKIVIIITFLKHAIEHNIMNAFYLILYFKFKVNIGAKQMDFTEINKK
jgi:hypothetical protein